MKSFLSLLAVICYSEVSSSQTCANPKVAWKPAVTELCNAKWGLIRATQATHSTSLDTRYQCVSNFKGHGPVFLVNTYKNIFNSLIDYRKISSGLKSNHIRKRVEMYIEPSYVPFSSGRFAYGIQISDPAKPGSNIGGGVLPKDQNGSSVRVNFKRVKINGKDQLTAQAYAYHLNRTSPILQSGGFTGKVSTKQYGTGPALTKALPQGEWFTLEIDVVLNDIGKSNGSIKISTLQNSQVTESKTQTGLIFRNNAKWQVLGPYMTDKYDTQAKAPVTSGVAYRNHEISICSN